MKYGKKRYYRGFEAQLFDMGYVQDNTFVDNRNLGILEIS
jgi:hypothetical protein